MVNIRKNFDDRQRKMSEVKKKNDEEKEYKLQEQRLKNVTKDKEILRVLEKNVSQEKKKVDDYHKRQVKLEKSKKVKEREVINENLLKT